ncbi:phytoene desaturase family protein [Sphingobacterium griseoflavum]|uniref:Phytoene dehydrogenase n=1 Tax=Sphingobacterium griseoflavum TaxID=1474952 RepID=A0ABQ3HT01_9SPHI|nr:phytoene desaturase family protein [Sphingobacterium griseoflavum]GHE23345.1 phytoene dehydrogenase [Sphingobacterium griseoflavum]
MKNKVAIIGSGFSGLSAACYLAAAGFEVEVFEKNAQFGGRARQFTTEGGFRFDMGPSWYWMPDVMVDFFRDFDLRVDDYYTLTPLNPQFEMVFARDSVCVPSGMDELRMLFEEIEPGAGQKFDRFMEAARFKYEVGMKDFVTKPCHSWWEFVDLKIVKSAIKLNLLTDFRSYVRQYFKDPRLVALMEFPVIFLGAAPKDIPAMYSLMNYGGYGLGTWYPEGGFVQVVEAMVKVAKNLGVRFHANRPVRRILLEDGRASGIVLDDETVYCDKVVGSADYQHVESLLPKDLQNYLPTYWQQRTFAPSCLIFYLGFNTQIDGLKHHTLFFEHELEGHVADIYSHKKWPEKPLFYVCCPSKTDSQVAPAGCENVFLLMPIATGLEDGDAVREHYFQQMMTRLEKHTGRKGLAQHIIYKRSYCVQDFMQDYNAYQGNAYGLANTLKQTAVWKPSIRNKKVKNLFYTGQLTVPGPGVPPAIISGKIVAQEIINYKEFGYEKIV